MSTWKISTHVNGIAIKHKNAEGLIVDVGHKPPSTPLEDLLGWVASEMAGGDVAILNGQLVLQKFSATVE